MVILSYPLYMSSLHVLSALKDTRTLISGLLLIAKELGNLGTNQLIMRVLRRASPAVIVLVRDYRYGSGVIPREIFVK